MSNVVVVSGHTIAGRYRLKDQLGVGGMGSVWRADDLTLGSPVAVKLIDPELAADESVRARFYQEAKAAAALRSPHVVQILDYGVDEGTPFIAMELLDGESLSDRLLRARVLHPTETARIFGDVARAVRRAHEAGIVHRDLKPENIFLVRNDDQEIAKVLDFGIAKAGHTLSGGLKKTQAGALIGTPPYMSPEQSRGAPVDLRTDLWALGVIAFECVCGRLPFDAQNHGELILQICSHPIPVPSQVARVPPGFDAWFARAVDRDPDRRFQSAREMADTLRPILFPGAVEAAPMSVAAPPVVAAPPRQAPSPPLATAPEPRVGTMNGGSTFVSGVDTRPRSSPQRRAAMLMSLAALAIFAVTALIWLGQGHTADTTANASAVPVTDTAASPDPATSAPPSSGPVVSPADPAPPPAKAVPQSTGKPTASVAPKPVETIAPKPVETVAPKPVETVAPKPVDKKKGKDRIGW